MTQQQQQQQQQKQQKQQQQQQQQQQSIRKEAYTNHLTFISFIGANRVIVELG